MRLLHLTELTILNFTYQGTWVNAHVGHKLMGENRVFDVAHIYLEWNFFSSFEGKCRKAGEGFAASMRHLVEREEGGGFREKGLPRPELQTLLLSFRSCSSQNPSSSFQSIIQTWNVLDALQPPFFAVSSTSIPKARPLSRTFPPWRHEETSALSLSLL